jgi:sugar-specific transcriptional regulator TrmB
MKNKFIKLGLSPSEAEVYQVLSQVKHCSATDITKRLSISPSNVYVALEKLIQRGMITKVSINSRPVYKINIELSAFEDNIKAEYIEKKKALKEIQENITKKHSSLQRDAQIYVGIHNLRSAYRDLFAQEGDEFVFFYKHDKSTVDIVHDFFSKMDVVNYYKNIPTRALFSKGYEKMFKQRKSAKFKVKFTNYPIPSSINVFGDKVLIIHWAIEPVAFILVSNEIANNFRDLFNEIWSL